MSRNGRPALSWPALALPAVLVLALLPPDARCYGLSSFERDLRSSSSAAADSGSSADRRAGGAGDVDSDRSGFWFRQRRAGESQADFYLRTGRSKESARWFVQDDGDGEEERRRRMAPSARLIPPWDYLHQGYQQPNGNWLLQRRLLEEEARLRRQQQQREQVRMRQQQQVRHLPQQVRRSDPASSSSSSGGDGDQGGHFWFRSKREAPAAPAAASAREGDYETVSIRMPSSHWKRLIDTAQAIDGGLYKSHRRT